MRTLAISSVSAREAGKRRTTERVRMVALRQLPVSGMHVLFPAVEALTRSRHGLEVGGNWCATCLKTLLANGTLHKTTWLGQLSTAHSRTLMSPGHWNLLIFHSTNFFSQAQTAKGGLLQAQMLSSAATRMISLAWRCRRATRTTQVTLGGITDPVFQRTRGSASMTIQINGLHLVQNTSFMERLQTHFILST